MKSIKQENIQSAPTSLSSLEKLENWKITDTFFDDYSFTSSFNMNRDSNSRAYTSNKLDPILAEMGSSKNNADQWVIVDDPPVEKSVKKSAYGHQKAPVSSVDTSSDAAQRKFGSAKAISSDQFFNDNRNDYETQTNLNRFQGSSSISSSDFFGNGRGTFCFGSSFGRDDDFCLFIVLSQITMPVRLARFKITIWRM